MDSAIQAAVRKILALIGYEIQRKKGIQILTLYGRRTRDVVALQMLQS